MVLIAQSTHSQNSYPKRTIDPSTGDTIVTFTANQVYGITDTLTKLVDRNTECRLVLNYKDSLLIAANKYITKQEGTIADYNQLKWTYLALDKKNKTIDSLYNAEIVLTNQKLDLFKKKTPIRWVTFIGIAILVAAASFLLGYYLK